MGLCPSCMLTSLLIHNWSLSLPCEHATMCSIDIAFVVESLIKRLDGCSLEDLVAGAWEVQDHLDRLADGGDHPRGLERGLASMSAVAEQRTKLQVNTSLCFSLLMSMFDSIFWCSLSCTSPLQTMPYSGDDNCQCMQSCNI